jgi:hypothetical protein
MPDRGNFFFDGHAMQLQDLAAHIGQHRYDIRLLQENLQFLAPLRPLRIVL